MFITTLILTLVLTAWNASPHTHSISSLVSDYISSHKVSLRNPNLALGQDGATVIHSSTAEIPFYGPNMWRLSVPPEDLHTRVALSSHKKGACDQAYGALNPFATPDRYWCFMGTRGQLGIALSHPGFLTNVSIDHPPLLTSLANAPRDVVFWGAVDGIENEQRYAQSADTIQRLQSRLHLHPPSPLQEDKELIYVPLAVAFYNIRSPELFQTFGILPEIDSLDMDFGLIIVQIVSNWGDSFTSLHHIGIYGQAAIEI